MKKISTTLLFILLTTSIFAQTKAQREARQKAETDSIEAVIALQNAIDQQNAKNAPATNTSATNPLPAPTNVNGSNTLVYIDNAGNKVTAKITTPSASGSPQWYITDASGMSNGPLLDFFSYRGNNGHNYETRVVSTPGNDPYKSFDVHFQSRKAGTEEFKKGRLIILDWNGNPLQVSVEYSNDNGIYFTFKPFQAEQ
jgi:hypothetical protein